MLQRTWTGHSIAAATGCSQYASHSSATRGFVFKVSLIPSPLHRDLVCQQNIESPLQIECFRIHDSVYNKVMTAGASTTPNKGEVGLEKLPG